MGGVQEALGRNTGGAAVAPGRYVTRYSTLIRLLMISECRNVDSCGECVFVSSEYIGGNVTL